jgi:hypothetical protein
MEYVEFPPSDSPFWVYFGGICGLITGWTGDFYIGILGLVVYVMIAAVLVERA